MQRLRKMVVALAAIGVSSLHAQAVAPPVPTASTEGDLRTALQRAQVGDIVRNPRPVVAALPDLIRRAERDPEIPFEEIVTARHTLAFARTYDNDHAGGIAELDRLAGDMRRRKFGGPLYEETFRRKAVILSALKKYDEAAAIYLDILAREERAGRAASALSSATLNGLAVLRARQGKYDEGEALGRRATAVGLAASDAKPQAVGDAWRTWVVLLGLAGKSNQAIVEAQKSLKYNETNLGEASESTVGAMNSLSSMLADAGRYAEAEAIQRRMIEVERRQTTTQGQTMAVWLGNFGTTLMSQGKTTEAEAVLRQARELMLTVKHLQRPDFLGILTLDLGNAIYAQGRTDEALALFRTALAELARDAGTDHPSWAHAQAEIGKVLIDQGKPAEALKSLTAARTVMGRSLDPADHLRLTADLLAGDAMIRTGYAGGYALARAAITSERAVLVGAATDPLRSALMARDRAGNFMRFARLALAADRLTDAFEAVQLAQFGDLDSAGAAWAARQAAATPALAAVTGDLQAAGVQLKQLQAKRTKAVAAADLAAVSETDRAIDAANGQAATLLVKLTADFPAYSNLVRPEPRPLADVQAALGVDEALVIATPTDSGGVISIVVSRITARGAVVELPRDALAGWAARLRASVDDGLDRPADATYDAAAAFALYKAIIPPSLDREAKRAAHLRVLTGGMLASVPLAALLTERPRRAELAGAALRDAPWLVRRQALSRPVSLAALGAPTRPRNPIRFAAIGAPTLSGPETGRSEPTQIASLFRSASGDAAIVKALPPLPAAETELQAMAAALNETAPLLLTGGSATKVRLFAADLRPYSVIAFATHGLVSGELRNLAEPALVLTPSDGGDGADGLLTASDVARLRLDADWIILSACNTSAGEGGAAPIYSGLARAFVQAGAGSLLLSHWPLRDDIAARLTVATVRLAAQGMPRAEALRRAQRDMFEDRTLPGAPHPALWAPFILIGN